MPNPVARLRETSKYKGPEDEVWFSLQLWCPGCDSLHAVNLPGPNGFQPSVCWEWDGNETAPTISPSILCYGSANGGNCHSFVRNGKWEFLSDSNHALAGQTVEMVPLPDWLVKE